MKRIVFSVLVLTTIFLSVPTAQALTPEKENEIYFAVLRMEIGLIIADPGLLVDKKALNLKLAEQAYPPVSGQYNISPDLVRAVYERGISRKFSDAEWAVIDKINAELDAQPASEDATARFSGFLAAAQNQGFTGGQAYDLLRRMQYQYEAQHSSNDQ